MEADIKALQQYLTEKAEAAIDMMKYCQEGGPDWSFFNGQIDGLITARWNLQLLLEKLNG